LNIVDKAIAFVSPRIALKREMARTRLSFMRDLKNSGYDQSGASTQKKSLKGWTAVSKSPQEDIDANLHTLRQRSRDLYMSSPLGVSAIKINRTNVIGGGLKLKAKIDYEILGLTREQAERWEKNTEREFDLWAQSKWCDALRLSNFYELQQLALISWLMNGDAWGLIKYEDPTSWMPYGLRIHLIEADRISTPEMGQITSSFIMTKSNTVGEAENGNTIYNGVEVDSNGTVVAYYICNQYPNSNIKGYKKEWVRVEAFGQRTGNPNILQIFEQERCEQYRGIPYLTPVIEALKQITRYTEAELTAAVVQAFFTAFIKYEGPKTEIPFGEVIPEEQQVDQPDPTTYELGAGTINVLGPNEDVVFADPKRPGSGFEGFVNNITKQIGAALEIPHELLTKNFMASYSASRAALLEAWKAFKMRRTWFSSDFTQPIYELWLAEAVARGRINAPGFFNDPIIRKAWARAEWIGPAQGQIDPTKEVEAAIMRVKQGFSTRERETYELTGGNWDDNIDQITRENELLAKANSVQQKEVNKDNGEEN